MIMGVPSAIAIIQKGKCVGVYDTPTVAKMLGVSKSAISHYLDNYTKPRSGEKLYRVGLANDHFSFEEYLKWCKEWDSTIQKIQKVKEELYG